MLQCDQDISEGSIRGPFTPGDIFRDIFQTSQARHYFANLFDKFFDEWVNRD